MAQLPRVWRNYSTSQVPIVGPATPGVMTPSFRAAGTPFQGFATDMSIAGAGVTVRERQLHARVLAHEE